MAVFIDQITLPFLSAGMTIFQQNGTCHFVYQLTGLLRSNQFTCMWLMAQRFRTSQQRATSSAEIHLAAKFGTCAECWDYETVGTVKQSRYIHFCRGWGLKQLGPWSSLGSHGYDVFTLLAVYLLSFKLNLTLKFFYGQSTPKATGILTKLVCISCPNLVIFS